MVVTDVGAAVGRVAAPVQALSTVVPATSRPTAATFALEGLTLIVVRPGEVRV
jgi:hypothetical protein